ncbi:MAG TPA: DEAD/DEAH box helicase family protein [Rectinemataceae bacterium]|nr:DEAD/DEAH box helicase family protein [Rectinemataceae bacterium]
MSKPVFRFDANLEHQVDSVAAVCDLFDGLVSEKPDFSFDEAIIPNLAPGELLDQGILLSNLRTVQRRARAMDPRAPLNAGLELDTGLPLEVDGLDNSSTISYPSFTVEMETGTGKTYVYFRTMYELYKRCGFSKFVIVVPSIAIYEGVVKTHSLVKDHFASMFGNERPPLVEYDGARVSELRSFASSFRPIILVTTLAAFNRASNVIYKASDKLPGELLPIEYLAKTRPVLILDEPQNYGTETAKAALRRLNPLVSLRYSATHRENPNPVYRLSPFEAFRRDLVKKVVVAGFSLEGAAKKNQLRLLRVDRAKQSAVLQATKEKNGRLDPGEVTVKQDHDLAERTGNKAYRGMIVHNIDFANGLLELSDGNILSVDEIVAGSDRKDLVRAQIKETIATHFRRQEELRARGIKILSLFFVDRVSHFLDEKDGYIRQIFDDEMAKAIRKSDSLKGHKPEDLRIHYFASVKKKKRGEGETEVFLDEFGGSADQKEAEKEAYDLIMRDKERLLALDEPRAFIFAHSALREGWDNPNVFQICSLNEARAETRKRQEIGRGLRLPVDQDGNRVMDGYANVLTVIAAESYASFARALQEDYEADGQTDRIPVANAHRSPVSRNARVFDSPEFRRFTSLLATPAHYEIKFSSEEFIDLALERIRSTFELPLPRIELRKGGFGFVRIELRFLETFARTFMGTESSVARFEIKVVDTLDRSLVPEAEVLLVPGESLSAKLGGKYPFLEPLVLERIEGEGDDAEAVFANQTSISVGCVQTLEETVAAEGSLREIETKEERFPLPNVIERVARATGLTRATVFAIWKRFPKDKKARIFLNPEGFIDRFAKALLEVVGDFVANNIQFVKGLPSIGSSSPKTSPSSGYPRQLEFAADDQHDSYGPARIPPTTTVFNEALEEAFPDPAKAVPSELLPVGERSLYEAIQTDSGVEQRFVRNCLESPGSPISYYFKFPGTFKIQLPKMIGGNYNPDWGICVDVNSGKTWLVRETKGNEDILKLRFSSEARKIVCGYRYFRALGIDYRAIRDDTVDWLKPTANEYRIEP